MGSARRYLLAAGAAAALALVGCGGGGGDEDAPAPRPAEIADAPAKQFPGGTVAVDEGAGFTIGVPHGWSASRESGVTVLGSPDGVVTVAVTADRTEEALETAPDAIAQSAIESLPGIENAKVAAAQPFRAFYPAVSAAGTATRTGDGLRQELRSFVLTRPDLAVFTVLASRNAKARSPFNSQVDAIVRSLRGRAVSVPG
jgi:hypothetical protein